MTAHPGAPTVLTTPIVDPVVPDVLPGAPVDSVVIQPHVNVVHEQQGSNTELPIHETDPADNVYQSDNVNQSDSSANVEPGTLSGDSTVLPPNARAEEIRGLTRENEAAAILVENGYDVEQNPDVPGDKEPDYLISGPEGSGIIGEGVVADAYSPSTSSTLNIVVNIDKKITSRQAEAVVVNLADSEATAQELIEALARNPVDDPVIIIDQQQNIYIVE